jgi:hypothetical protein
MTRLGTLLFVAALVSLVAVPSVAAGPRGTDRPFKAALTGVVLYEFPGPACPIVTTVTESSGRATHLGRVAASWSHCPAAPEIVMDGMVTITAANGDTLTGTYDYDPASPILSFPINWTGGTGRFSDATGSVIGVYTVTPQFIPGCVPDPDPFPCYDFTVPWPWSGTLSGTINY